MCGAATAGWSVASSATPTRRRRRAAQSASARDMATWVRVQLRDGVFDGREIVKPAALAETHFPQIATGPAHDPMRGPTFYGLGWDIDYGGPARQRWSHSGGFALGAATCAYVMPAERFGIVVLTNSAPVGAPETICRSFLDLVLTGKIERDWLALFGESLRGNGDSDIRSGRRLRKAPGQRAGGARRARHMSAIIATSFTDPLGSSKRPKGFRLPWARRPRPIRCVTIQATFSPFSLSGENASGLSPVRFSRNGDEKAASVVIDYFNGNGQGVFMRS